MKTIRWIERLSRPRLRFLFDHRASNAVFGLIVIAGSLAAFLAPPFTGLDTLPSLGVVLLSLVGLAEMLARKRRCRVEVPCNRCLEARARAAEVSVRVLAPAEARRLKRFATA